MTDAESNSDPQSYNVAITGSGCVMRVSGVKLDINNVLSLVKLQACAIHRMGEQRTGFKSQVHQSTSFNVVVSEASEHDFDRQVSDAIEFLKEHGNDIRNVMAMPGVDGGVLDFAIARRDFVVQNDYFPPQLLSLAGSLGLGINIAQYSIGDADHRC
jgi:hypothetical protein